MKKFLLSVFFLLGGAGFSGAFADDPQDVYLTIVNEDEANMGNTKAPARPLIVSLADGVLSLPAMPVDYQFQMLDENGTLVYSALIPAGSTQIVLPAMTGNFEIRLVADTYYFKGYITL